MNKIFIGCSSEELDLAKSIKELLKNDFDVTIWDEKLWAKRTFKINDNYLFSLLQAALIHDFAILLGTADDLVEYRDEVVLQPRDNILFEYGLFMGRLGKSRTALLVEKDVKIPSDINGLSIERFIKTDISL